MKRHQEQLGAIAQEIARAYQTFGSQMSLFGQLDPNLAQSNLEVVGDLREKLAGIQVTDDAYYSEVYVPYAAEVLDAIEANIMLKTAGVFRDSDELYNLSMQADAIPSKLTADAVESYHRAAQEFFELQRQVKGVEALHVGTSKAAEYERRCTVIAEKLDNLASHWFKRKIFTATKLDIKENKPHQFLGQTNIGYHGLEPELVQVMAHEGALGHNTQQTLTEERKGPFYLQNRHASEGLAIVGETLALAKFYQESQHQAMVEFLKAKRRMNSAIGAAYERLAFHDRASVARIADELDSILFPRKKTLQMLTGFEDRRETAFNFASTPYFVGAKMLGETYNNAVDRVREMDVDDSEKQKAMAALFNTMYTGHRSARIIDAQVRLLLDEIAGPKRE